MVENTATTQESLKKAVNNYKARVMRKSKNQEVIDKEIVESISDGLMGEDG